MSYTVSSDFVLLQGCFSDKVQSQPENPRKIFNHQPIPVFHEKDKLMMEVPSTLRSISVPRWWRHNISHTRTIDEGCATPARESYGSGDRSSSVSLYPGHE